MQALNKKRTTGSIFFNSLALMVIFSLFGSNVPAAQARAEMGAAVETSALAQALCTDSGRGSIKETTHGAFVSTEKGNPIRVNPSFKNGSKSDVAVGFLGQCNDTFSAQSAASQFSPSSETPSSDGRATAVRLQQVVNGLPVFGGEMLVRLDENSDVLAVTGETLSDSNIDMTPVVDEAAATANAINYVAQKFGLDPALLLSTTPELWIYDPGLIAPEDGPAVLVWNLNVFISDGSMPVNQLVLVNAYTGEVALEFSNNKFLYQFEIYNAAGDTVGANDTLYCYQVDKDGNGQVQDSTLVTEVVSCAGDATADSVETSLQSSYNYFVHVLGQTYMGAPPMQVRFNYATYYDSGSGDMNFTNAMAVQRDVVAHEYAHVVVQNTVNLFPYYQSGAINESFADVMGQVIQHKIPYFGTGTYDWNVGGRSMSNPTIKKMSDMPTYFTTYCTGTQADGSQYYRDCDNGGVHVLNGVGNYLAYKLINDYGWTGDQFAALYYMALTQYLTSGSDYTDLGLALPMACDDLVGDLIGDTDSQNAEFIPSVTTENCLNLDFVIGTSELLAQPSNGSPDAAYCSLDTDVVDSLFSEDVETTTSVSANWTLSGWKRWVNNASGGIASFYADDSDLTSSVATLEMKNGVPLPNTATYLYFKHYYGFDDDYSANAYHDGGILEYTTSSNGGTTWDVWKQASPLGTPAFPMTNGYNGILDGDTNNPMYSAKAFVADSHGFVGTLVDLTAIQGKMAKFRWKMGVDATGDDEGWYVDDINIYNCISAGVTIKTTPIRSRAANDGYILESGETTNKGGTADSSSIYINIGDNSQDRQYRSIVSFPTASLDNTAVITSAIICIRRYGTGLVGNNDPFTWGNGLTADLRKGYFAGGSPISVLSVDDFAIGSTIKDAVSFSTVAATTECGSGIWYFGSVSVTALSSISVTSNTQFRLRFVLDDNDDGTDDYRQFFSGDALAGQRPKLILSYYIP